MTYSYLCLCARKSVLMLGNPRATLNLMIKDMESVGKSFRRGDKGPTGTFEVVARVVTDDFIAEANKLPLSGQLVMEVANLISQLKEWIKETGGMTL